MEEEKKYKSLSDLARALKSRKESNNLIAIMELLFQSTYMYHVMQGNGEVFPEEDLQILRKAFDQLAEALEPILGTPIEL